MGNGLAYSQQPAPPPVSRNQLAPDERPTTVYADALAHDEPESSPMTAAPRTSTNRLSIAAVVLSFLGITAVIGVICGHVARLQIRRVPEHGDQLAKAALWIGYSYIGAATLCLVAYLAIAGQGS